MSAELIKDVSFVDSYKDKLFIQTMGADGLRFKLGEGQWIKLDPIVNPDYKDYEGAGDWTSSTLIAALCSKGMLKVENMTEEAVKEVLMMAQTMASYSVGFIGSKGLIHADEKFKLQDDTLEMPHYSKKLMYLHGSASAGYSRTSMGILQYLPEDWQLLTPDCPADADECLKMLKELCEREQPDLIIGSSQGGYYAQMLMGYKPNEVHAPGVGILMSPGIAGSFVLYDEEPFASLQFLAESLALLIFSLETELHGIDHHLAPIIPYPFGMLAIDGLHVHLNVHTRLYCVFTLNAFFGISSSTELHEVEQAFGAVDCYAFYNDRCLIEIAQYAPFFSLTYGKLEPSRH